MKLFDVPAADRAAGQGRAGHGSQSVHHESEEPPEHHVAEVVVGGRRQAQAMRIRAGTGVCVGSGQCVLTEPSLFDQDDDGIVVLLSDQPGDGTAARAREAVSLRPSQTRPSWRSKTGYSERIDASSQRSSVSSAAGPARNGCWVPWRVIAR